jgi:hypothetical protein
VKVAVGPFHLTIQGALAAASPVDFMFVDGHHDQRATLRYFEMALNYLADDSLAVFDDINWSDGMDRAWAQLPHIQPARKLLPRRFWRCTGERAGETVRPGTITCWRLSELSFEQRFLV